MQLKYHSEISQHQNCPPREVEQQGRLAFRFVHSSISDPRNFLPVAKLQPNRAFNHPAARCDALSLSMFSSEQSAVSFYQSLARGYPNVRKTIGSHLAAGTINEEDGWCTPDRHDGHFSFFEAQQVQLVEQFRIVKALAQ